MSTLSIVPPMFDTYQPNTQLIHQKVAAAIDQAEGQAPKKPTDTVVASSGSSGDSSGASSADGSATAGPAGKHTKKPKQPETVTGGSIGSLHDGYAANESQDLDSAC